MLEKEIKYVDYNGQERKETFMFHITEAELTEMELSTTGGFTSMVQKMIEAKDTPALIKLFKDIILKSYGVKSPDGRRFIKSEELSTEFSQTDAYTKLYMELVTDDKAAADFINRVVPAEISKKASELSESGELEKLTN